jgi:hypothetical protein
MKARSIGLCVSSVVIVLLLLIYAGPDIVSLFRRETMVSSTLDHEAYVVCEEFDNKQEAANILARINQMFVRVITHLKRNRMDSPYSEQIAYLSSNYSPLVLGEHIPTNLKYTSFVEKKGVKIRMCLRTVEDRHKFHDYTTLSFVALHELSHLAVRSYGHDQNFWSMFRFILLEASSMGEIKLIDYAKFPQRYCGLPNDIRDNPAIDSK